MVFTIEGKPEVSVTKAGPEQSKTQAPPTLLARVEATPGETQISEPGQILFERRCSSCHVLQQFAGSEKSLAELEDALMRMEAMGVMLDEVDKVTLLEYLANLD